MSTYDTSRYLCVCPRCFDWVDVALGWTANPVPRRYFWRHLLSLSVILVAIGVTSLTLMLTKITPQAMAVSFWGAVEAFFVGGVGLTFLACTGSLPKPCLVKPPSLWDMRYWMGGIVTAASIVVYAIWNFAASGDLRYLPMLAADSLAFLAWIQMFVAWNQPVQKEKAPVEPVQ